MLDDVGGLIRQIKLNTGREADAVECVDRI